MSEEIVMQSVSLLIELAGAVVSGMATDGLELLVTPLLRCLGNLLANEETDRCRERIQDGQMLVALFVFMQVFLQQHLFVVRECLWVINNLTAGDPLFCSAMLHLNLVPALHPLLLFSGGVNVLVLTVLCNIAEQGPAYCQQLRQKEVLPSTLKMVEPEVVCQSLELLQLLFVHCPEATREFITQSGAQALEMLQYHSNQEIRLRAISIMETHLSQHNQICMSACESLDGL